MRRLRAEWAIAVVASVGAMSLLGVAGQAVAQFRGHEWGTSWETIKEEEKLGAAGRRCFGKVPREEGGTVRCTMRFVGHVTSVRMEFGGDQDDCRGLLSGEYHVRVEGYLGENLDTFARKIMDGLNEKYGEGREPKYGWAQIEESLSPVTESVGTCGAIDCKMTFVHIAKSSRQWAQEGGGVVTAFYYGMEPQEESADFRCSYECPQHEKEPMPWHFVVRYHSPCKAELMQAELESRHQTLVERRRKEQEKKEQQKKRKEEEMKRQRKAAQERMKEEAAKRKEEEERKRKRAEEQRKRMLDQL